MSEAAVDATGTAPSTGSDSAHVSQTIGKRKRSNEPEHPAASNGIIKNGDITVADRDRFNSLLLDILEVLKCHDTEPSVLNFKLESIEESKDAKKRAKTNSASADTTLGSRLASQGYSNIDDVASDVSKAVSLLKASSNSHATKAVLQFEEMFNQLIINEMGQHPDHLLRSLPISQDIKEEDKKLTAASTNQHNVTVLSLFGGIHGERHGRTVFSSDKVERRDPLDSLPKSVFTGKRPILATSLPGGVSATTIITSSSRNFQGEPKMPPTLGQVCRPTSPKLPKNPLPTTSTKTSTRDSTVGWFNPTTLTSPVKKSGIRESYNYQPLSTGQWLSYNVPATSPPQSTGEKRKQRDRALSTGEPTPKISEEELEVYQAKRNRDLFKSVYSSFAPSYDDSYAVVPSSVKSKYWWYKTGQFLYQDEDSEEDTAAGGDQVPALSQDKYSKEDAAAASNLDPALFAGEDASKDQSEIEDEATAFKAAVDKFQDTQEWDINASTSKQHGSLTDATSVEEKDVDEILENISELIGIVYSYQRVRHMSRPKTNQSSASQNKTLEELSGSPSTPSEAEFDTYDILRNQLALMVSSLPPYALAKLNGDQLNELNISRKIQIQEPSHRGLIPEEVSKPSQHTSAMRSQNSTAPKPNVPYTPQAPIAAQRASFTGAPNYHGIRPQPTAMQSPHVPKTAPIPRQYQQYSSQSNMGQMHSQQMNARQVLPNGYGNHNMANATPIQQRPVQPLQRAPPPNFQQRPSNSAYSTPGYGMASGHQISPPQKMQGYPAQYSPHTHGGQNHSHSSQGSPQRMASISSQGVNGVPQTIGQQINISVDEARRLEDRRVREQQEMMDRQRAKLAHRNSGTPQPANGQSPLRPQSNGTPSRLQTSPTPPQVNGQNGI